MTVKDLIGLLQAQPQDLLVVYKVYSEHCLLTLHDLGVSELCDPRPDGWVHDKRLDKSTQMYLVIPGN